MRYRLVKISAWGALFWERLWPALWPAAALLALLFALALLGLWQMLPGVVAGIGLALYLAAVIIVLVAGLWPFRLPTHDEVLRWIERRNGLAHRPLAMTEDRPATPHSTTADILWGTQQARAATAREGLGLKLPHPRLAALDPWGLRILAALVLILGLIAGGRHWKEAAGFLMSPPFGYAAENIGLTAWLDPPAYTGKPPRALAAGSAATVQVPEGTKLTLRANGARRTPVLSAAGTERTMAQDEDQSYALVYDLRRSGDYRLRVGARQVGQWHFNVRKDQPPAIAFDGVPTVTARQSLNIRYAVTDDYGAEKAELVLTRVGSSKEVHLALPLPPRSAGEVKASTYENLVAHPWAGILVQAELRVTDSAGQTGKSPVIAFTLPERAFKHPVARQLVKLRKMLAAQPDIGPYVAQQLDLILTAPHAFNDDLVAYLAIRTALLRTADGDPANLDETLDLLWDTALRIEDGTLSTAENDMRQSIDALKNALTQPGGDNQAMQKMMQDLQQKMADYMKAMAQKQAGNGQQGARNDDTGDQQNITAEDLQRMLQQIETLAETGATQEAGKKLAQLQSMMENMQVADQGDQDRQRRLDGARQQIDRLRQQQKKLMDETFMQSSRDSQPRNLPLQPGKGEATPSEEKTRGDAGKAADNPAQSLSQRQEQIKAGLLSAAQSMNATADGNQSMRSAAQAMQEAQQALQGGALDKAVDSQAQALQSLAQAVDSLSKQMGQNPAEGNTADGTGGLGQTDSGKNMVPTSTDLGRARQILDEIRRRAGEWQRPEKEREYLNRLLDQF